jgi:hypothetical protein
MYTDESIGTNTSPSTTDIFVGDELGFDDASKYLFESQVMIAATCFGTTIAITVGAGNYSMLVLLDPNYKSSMVKRNIFASVLTS